METKEINEQLKKFFLERLGHTNTTKEMLDQIRPGLYIARGQSEVCHKSHPNDWQYFGPYEEPVKVQRYHSIFGDDNETHYEDGEIKEFEVKCDWTDDKVKVKAQLIKTWEEFDEEDDNVHHFYHEEYKILEVL